MRGLGAGGGAARRYKSNGDHYDPKRRKWTVIHNAWDGLNITTQPGLVAKVMERFHQRYHTMPPEIVRVGVRGPVALSWILTEREAGLFIEYLKTIHVDADHGAPTLRRFYGACLRQYNRRIKERPGFGGLGCPACLLPLIF